MFSSNRKRQRQVRIRVPLILSVKSEFLKNKPIRGPALNKALGQLCDAGGRIVVVIHTAPEKRAVSLRTQYRKDRIVREGPIDVPKVRADSEFVIVPGLNNIF